MIEPDHPLLTISKQCELLDINRAVYYYERRESRTETDLEDLKRILEVLREIPFYGYRKISIALTPDHPHLTRKRVRRIMRRFGLRALYARRSLSKARKDHKKYPYLLRGKKIRHPNQVWASDLTYLKGKLFLVFNEPNGVNRFIEPSIAPNR